MPESTEEEMEKVDQLHTIRQAIFIFEKFVEGVAAKQIDGIASDSNMAEAHFLYFKQMGWIELFMGKWYTTEDGKNVLSYLKLKFAKVFQDS